MKTSLDQRKKFHPLCCFPQKRVKRKVRMVSGSPDFQARFFRTSSSASAGQRILHRNIVDCPAPFKSGQVERSVYRHIYSLILRLVRCGKYLQRSGRRAAGAYQKILFINTDAKTKSIVRLSAFFLFIFQNYHNDNRNNRNNRDCGAHDTDDNTRIDPLAGRI